MLIKAKSLLKNVFFSVTAQFAGEDPVVALEAALQFEDTRESMQAFCVGQYMEVSKVPLHVSNTLFSGFHHSGQIFDFEIFFP